MSKNSNSNGTSSGRVSETPSNECQSNRSTVGEFVGKLASTPVTVPLAVVEVATRSDGKAPIATAIKDGAGKVGHAFGEAVKSEPLAIAGAALETYNNVQSTREKYRSSKGKKS